jgi:hypothetical protein
VVNYLENLALGGVGPFLSWAVGAHCLFVITSSVAVASGTDMGMCVMVFVCTDATQLSAIIPLPVVAELLTFGTLISWACGEVFSCPH